MPCVSPEPTYEELYAEWELRLRHNSPTASAFCELCKLCDLSNFKLPPAAQEWWTEHRERDRKRLEAEKAAVQREIDRKNALAKLSTTERQLLGIDDLMGLKS